MERTWSPYQEAIFDWFTNGTGNLVVRARAGTGKTTTILEGVARAKSAKRPMLCAFNKRIAEELTARLRRVNSHAEAKTLHALGFACVRSAWGSKVRPEGSRGMLLARKAWAMAEGAQPDGAPGPVVAAVAKLAGLVKNVDPLAPCQDIDKALPAIEAVGANMDVEVEGVWATQYPLERLAKLALRALDLAMEQDGTIDFDDMLWLPVVHGWMRPTYDLLVVDEAQDMNRCQLVLAMGLASGRIAVVGDDRQAIYGFRGADSNAIDNLKAELAAEELPLTVTYRCPQAVVAIAQGIVPDFEAAPEAPQGQVSRVSEETMLAMARPGDFILSRKNAPLATHCLALLRAGVPARIQGRDIAKGLIGLVQRMEQATTADLFPALEEHQTRERERLARTKNQNAEAKLELLADQVDTLSALAEGLVTTGELVERIQEMFSDQGTGVVVLSSVHKAKGLEAQQVFVLEATLYCGGKRFTTEEENIHYVAVTRAMERLVLVTDKPAPEGGRQEEG